MNRAILPLVVALSACAAREPVSTTTTTAADVADTSDVPTPAMRSAPRCKDVARAIEFRAPDARLTAYERVDLDRWAACLNAPELQHTTVVLSGRWAPADDDHLFERRAAAIREGLVRRGVDGRRIVVAGRPTVDGKATRRGAWIAITPVSSQTLRAIAPVDPAVRPGVR